MTEPLSAACLADVDVRGDSHLPKVAPRDESETRFTAPRVRRSVRWLALVAGVLCVGTIAFAFVVPDVPPAPDPAGWAPAEVAACPRWHSDYCEVCLSTRVPPRVVSGPSAAASVDVTGSEVRESVLFRDVLRDVHPTHSWVSTERRLPSGTAGKLEASPELRARLRALLDSGELDAGATIRALQRDDRDEAGDPELRLVRAKLGLPPDRR